MHTKAITLVIIVTTYVHKTPLPLPKLKPFLLQKVQIDESVAISPPKRRSAQQMAQKRATLTAYHIHLAQSINRQYGNSLDCSAVVAFGYCDW